MHLVSGAFCGDGVMSHEGVGFGMPQAVQSIGLISKFRFHLLPLSLPSEGLWVSDRGLVELWALGAGLVVDCFGCREPSGFRNLFIRAERKTLNLRRVVRKVAVG